MRETTLRLQAEPLIRSALREDITSEDVSTISVVDGTERGRVHLLAKEDGVICGLDVFERTFQLLDPTARLKAAVREGDDVTVGEELGVVHGHVEALLSGERVALNFLQRMSGIATLTRAMARELAGTRTRLVDTRKTTPNMRVFEREAVRVGGGANHRYNLSDGVMLKDNHIDAAGGISQAVAAARARAPFVRKVEVEVESLVQLREALAAGADIVMLDNMDLATMRTAVGMVDGRAEVEVSGNVTLGRLHDLAELGVDVISCGALTHSAPILDLSLKHLVVTGRRAS
ncbi:nicotinate-nucleotide pyrophosphorylase (carboxylating) [Olsenella profusa DSM 13989]|uniref:carboxylating nicotinate-nucleotide diphosphorylase n=1 Tax=Olsenella profusa TaxID=138595 RepID=UPI00277D89C1|nr:carboxylating nicotinate-nucleotide diphosphorylase [Olsenella profusa]MDP9859571.1 nicotinate-nucleotide pyrophosphorylase (carboxylating) [Olsenella profusa DSM 13989]